MSLETFKREYSLEYQPVPAKEDAGDAIWLVASHPALHFCWHLRMGFHREIETKRLWEYADFFYATYLRPHLQRQQVFLNAATEFSPLISKKALLAHRALHRQFTALPRTSRTLGRAEEKLEEHARFEKSVLGAQLHFIRNRSGRERFDLLVDQSLGRELGSWTDRFWELE